MITDIEFKNRIIGNSEQILTNLGDTFITFRIRNSRAVIDYLLIGRGNRGQGIGTELINRFEDIARARGVKSIWLRACQWDITPEHHIIKFYEKNGYKTINDYKGIGMQMFKNLFCSGREN